MDKEGLEKIEHVDKKVQDVNGLVTATTLSTKVGEVKNKVPNVSRLLTTTLLNTKFREVQNKFLDHAKYITNAEFNKFSGTIFDAKLRQVNLATNHDLDAILKRAIENKAK